MGDLQALYHELLSKIDVEDQLFSFRLFIWVAFARRRLTPSELAKAVTIAPDTACRSSTALEKSSLAEFMADRKESKTRIRALSCGLTETQFNYAIGDDEVQFIHKSVSDFFLREQGLLVFDKSLTSLKLIEAYANDYLYKACINHITSLPDAELCQVVDSICRDKYPRKKYMQFFACRWSLLKYAFEFWHVHVAIEESTKLDVVKPDKVLEYFHWPDSTYFNQWLKLSTHVDSVGRWRERSQRSTVKSELFEGPHEGVSFIHVACSLGLVFNFPYASLWGVHMLTLILKDCRYGS